MNKKALVVDKVSKKILNLSLTVATNLAEAR
jgi:hypothetical protein